MKTILLGTALATLFGGLGRAQGQGINPVVDPMDYDHEGVELQGFLAAPPDVSAPVPAVVIIPDWDGVNFYEQQRATMVATQLGWVGFAADIYGKDLHQVDEIQDRIELSTLYRSDPNLFAQRIQSAVAYVKTMDMVDADNVAVVGYCFGGTGVLQYAFLGLNGVQAIVSVHGGLLQVPEASESIHPKVLVLSGGEDDTSTAIMDLEVKLDDANATWEITRYSDIVHAWTVFGSPAYNEWADQRSWESMVRFLEEAFGETVYESRQPDSTMVEGFSYTDDFDGKALMGYVAKPDSSLWKSPAPAVVIIPDWDGVNTYEQERATLLSKYGYVGFAADIYGEDLQTDLDLDTRIEQATLYRGDPSLFVRRMQRAVDVVKSMDFVDGDKIAMIGYCFGGTGVVQYAFSPNNGDVMVVAAYHGGLQTLPEVTADTIVPYTLILSGGEDDAHGNQTILEEVMNGGDAEWEISRWSGVVHGFTNWANEAAYSIAADYRSWDQLMTTLNELMPAMSVDDFEDAAPPTSSPTSAGAGFSTMLAIASGVLLMVTAVVAI